MQFVHITDLHFKTDDAFQRELIRQLLIDLEAAHGKTLNPDFLVFSGDLVKNPDDKDIFPTFEREFLIPVLSALQLPPSKVVLCPGNHDISWSVLKDRGLTYDALQSKLKDQDYITDQGRKNELKTFARDIGTGFFDLAARYGGSWDNPFSKVYSFDAEKVSFVALNSAFGCSLKGSEADRGHLAVSAELALDSFLKVPSGHKIISLVHHTFGDMTEGTTRLLVPTIEKYADVHCFGHVHQPKPTAGHSVSGSCFNVQGGALYEKDGHYNGYAIVRLAQRRRAISKLSTVATTWTVMNSTSGRMSVLQVCSTVQKRPKIITSTSFHHPLRMTCASGF
jgi:3',5'-cyclic AMP phosphodiesterase CpdA